MPLRIFSLYDIGMPVKATEHQIDAWVSEAEAGYDVEALKNVVAADQVEVLNPPK